MDTPFNRGLAWYRYKGLEEEFINAIKYFPFEKEYAKIWSEFFGDLLIKVGNSIDSYFRNMLKDSKFDSFPNVIALREKKEKIDINYFRKFFEPIYKLSDAEIDISYGLIFYDTKHCPFAEFKNDQIPPWWTSYNHVKHKWFDCIKEATLENVVSALAGLFLLNILHKQSQEYLLKNQNVILFKFQSGFERSDILEMMNESMFGVRDTWRTYDFVARTPLFKHTFRLDKKDHFAGWFNMESSAKEKSERRKN